LGKRGNNPVMKNMATAKPPAFSQRIDVGGKGGNGREPFVTAGRRFGNAGSEWHIQAGPQRRPRRSARNAIWI
jgi:hypothetical protein